MGKYYAAILDPEYFDWKTYYSEDEAEQDDIVIFGNSWTIGNDVYKGFSNDMASIACELYKEITNFVLSDNEVPLNDLQLAFDDAIDDAFGTNDYTFTSTDRSEIFEACHAYMNANTEIDELEALCEIRFIQSGKTKRYMVSSIHGSSQGDYAIVVYPEDKANLLDYIEAVVFGTGTEVAVCDQDLSDAEQVPTASTLSNFDTFTIYTPAYSESDIKKEIAEELGCSPSEIVLLDTADEALELVESYGPDFSADAKQQLANSKKFWAGRKKGVFDVTAFHLANDPHFKQIGLDVGIDVFAAFKDDGTINLTTCDNIVKQLRATYAQGNDTSNYTSDDWAVVALNTARSMTQKRTHQAINLMSAGGRQTAGTTTSPSASTAASRASASKTTSAPSSVQTAANSTSSGHKTFNGIADLQQDLETNQKALWDMFLDLINTPISTARTQHGGGGVRTIGETLLDMRIVRTSIDTSGSLEASLLRAFTDAAMNNFANLVGCAYYALLFDQWFSAILRVSPFVVQTRNKAWPTLSVRAKPDSCTVSAPPAMRGLTYLKNGYDVHAQIVFECTPQSSTGAVGSSVVLTMNIYTDNLPRASKNIEQEPPEANCDISSEYTGARAHVHLAPRPQTTLQKMSFTWLKDYIGTTFPVDSDIST